MNLRSFSKLVNKTRLGIETLFEVQRSEYKLHNHCRFFKDGYVE